MRGLVVLMFLLVIVIDSAQSRTIPRTAPAWSEQQETQSKRKGMSGIRLESLDVSLCAKAGDPAFLYPLCFHLE